MTNENIILLVWYGLSALIGVIKGIKAIIDAKDEEEIIEGLSITIVSLSPIIMIVSGVIIMLFMCYIIIYLPTLLIVKIKKL
jgi:hypothetical protein